MSVESPNFLDLFIGITVDEWAGVSSDILPRDGGKIIDYGGSRVVLETEGGVIVGARWSIAGQIKFGLNAIKGVGDGAAHAIIRERNGGGPFRNIYDFARRISIKEVSKSAMLAMARCGAFGSTGWNRAQVISVIDDAIEMGRRCQEEKSSGQMNMFG